MATKKAASKKAGTKKAGGSTGGRGGSSSRAKRGRKGVNVLLREVDPTVLDILKARAEREGRSLQQELHLALRREAKRNYEEALAIAEAWQKRLSGRDLPSSLELIREDRDR